MSRRLGTEVSKGFCFERDDLGLIDLEDVGAAGPRQAVGPGVQAGREDHRLADPRLGRLDEEVVEESGAHRDLLIHGAAIQQRIVSVADLAVDELHERVDADRTNQRVSPRVVQ